MRVERLLSPRLVERVRLRRDRDCRRRVEMRREGESATSLVAATAAALSDPRGARLCVDARQTGSTLRQRRRHHHHHATRLPICARSCGDDDANAVGAEVRRRGVQNRPNRELHARHSSSEGGGSSSDINAHDPRRDPSAPRHRQHRRSQGRRC